MTMIMTMIDDIDDNDDNEDIDDNDDDNDDNNDDDLWVRCCISNLSKYTPYLQGPLYATDVYT